jgi:hypothetical protein
MISKNPHKIKTLNVDAIIRGGLRRYTDQVNVYTFFVPRVPESSVVTYSDACLSEFGITFERPLFKTRNPSRSMCFKFQCSGIDSYVCGYDTL